MANVIYGALALLLCVGISNYFAPRPLQKIKKFALCAASTFILISLLGGIFYSLKLGFFVQLQGAEEIALRIFGLALFLAVLVAMKAVNSPISQPAEHEPPETTSELQVQFF